MAITLTGGLDVPISGKPEQAIHSGPEIRWVALLGDDEGDEGLSFPAYDAHRLPNLERDRVRDRVRDNLLASGLWTAFRARPYSKVPAADAVPHFIFVTAMDTNPLVPRPAVVIAEYRESFLDGLSILPALTDGSMSARRPETKSRSRGGPSSSRSSPGRIPPACRAPTSISWIRSAPPRRCGISTTRR